jgi:hypothetical protein
MLIAPHTMLIAAQSMLIVPHSMPSLLQRIEAAMARALPTVRVEVDSTSLGESTIKEQILFQASSGARKELASVYNFASFYLATIYQQFPRIVYLDTDVIVQGDIMELAEGHLDLEGHPVAAVEDCSQRFEIYFNWHELAKFGNVPRQTCVFNHGIFVMDTDKWRKDKVTEKIELWMGRFAKGGGTLYKFGQNPLSCFVTYESGIYKACLSLLFYQ